MLANTPVLMSYVASFVLVFYHVQIFVIGLVVRVPESGLERLGPVLNVFGVQLARSCRTTPCDHSLFAELTVTHVTGLL